MERRLAAVLAADVVGYSRLMEVDEGRLVARPIPGAEFIELPGNNHVAIEGTAEFDRFFEEVRPFLAAHAG